MSNPSRIGDLAQDVLRLARSREGMTREQRLRLSAAALLAHLTNCHGQHEAAEVLGLSLHLAAHNAHNSADTALQALADIAEAAEDPDNAMGRIRDILAASSAALRPTLPPFEERAAVDRNPLHFGFTCPGYLAHGSSKVPCERCGLLQEEHV